MKGELLELIPEKYLCPKCGKWHKHEGDSLSSYGSVRNSLELRCPIDSDDDDVVYIFFDDDDECYYYDDDGNYDRSKGISEFSEIGESRVQMIDCEYNLKLGFEFKPEEYAKIYAAEILEEVVHKEQALQEREKELTQREKKLEENEKAQQQAKKEEANIMSKVTTFKKQIYEHSPKENVELIKEFLEKYKGTLKWLVPVVSIYGAYRVLNAKDAKLNVSNLNKNCKKELGFEFDILKDKKALKELVAFGGVVAGAYALCKIFDSTDKPEELSVEEIEGKMDSVEEAHQKFAWIQPKAEKLMPVATSVLVVYVLTQKPEWYEKAKDKIVAITGDASAKVGVYTEMAKLFVASKLNIDLDDEAQAKKFKTFALLAAIIGLCAFLYGKGVFNMEEDKTFMEKNPQLKAFIEQVKEIMEKLLPTAFSAVTTYMVTKHIIDAKEEENGLEEEKKNAVDADFNDVNEETVEEK